jgi:hypothetical protein
MSDCNLADSLVGEKSTSNGYDAVSVRMSTPDIKLFSNQYLTIVFDENISDLMLLR